MHILQQAEDMVKLRIQKDEDNIGTFSLQNTRASEAYTPSMTS